MNDKTDLIRKKNSGALHREICAVTVSWELAPSSPVSHSIILRFATVIYRFHDVPIFLFLFIKRNLFCLFYTPRWKYYYNAVNISIQGVKEIPVPAFAGYVAGFQVKRKTICPRIFFGTTFPYLKYLDENFSSCSSLTSLRWLGKKSLWERERERERRKCNFNDVYSVGLI